MHIQDRMPINILLLEDHPPIRKLLKSVLSYFKPDLVEATTVDEALSGIENRPPAIAILDVMVPGDRNGFDLCEILKTRFGDKVKVIMLTARTQQTDIAKGQAAKADYYLTKPFSPTELSAILAAEIQKSAG